METMHIEVKKITPINFCGQTIIWELEVEGVFMAPREIDFTLGEHDFNDCKTCQNTLVEISRMLRKRFEGGGSIQPFPYCCNGHRKLAKHKDFEKAYFRNVPEMVARKIIYTNQHIVNNQTADNWYKEITDYIDYAVLSFGKTPKNCGEPLYLHDYLDYTKHYIESNRVLSKKKKEQLILFVDKFQKPNVKKESDSNLQSLLSIYEKWLNIFPFELSLFSDLKEKYYGELPVLDGAIEINKYTGLAQTKIHTKESLIKYLLNHTDNLLKEINSLTLFEAGKLSDVEKLGLEIIINSRKIKIKNGYSSTNSDEEIQYHKMINEWFEDEKKFIEEIKPYILELKTTKPSKQQILISPKTGERNKEIPSEILKVFIIYKEEYEKTKDLKKALTITTNKIEKDKERKVFKSEEVDEKKRHKNIKDSIRREFQKYGLISKNKAI